MIKKIVSFFDLIKEHIHLDRLETKARKCVSHLEDMAERQLCMDNFNLWLSIYQKKSIELREIMKHGTSERREKLESFIEKVQNKYLS
jgi:hypothetical protein